MPHRCPACFTTELEIYLADFPYHQTQYECFLCGFHWDVTDDKPMQEAAQEYRKQVISKTGHRR